MDWVDYKRFTAKYRTNYENRGSHVSMLLSLTVSSYCEYRSCCLEGKLESVTASRLGWFLYHLAETENMIHGVEYERLDEFDDNEWGMVEMASKISNSYISGALDYNALQVWVAKWLRAYFPVVYTNRSFNDALLVSVQQLQEKHGH